MAYKISKYNSTKHECNVLSNLLNPAKRKKSKISHSLPILQVCLNTRSRNRKFTNFRILLRSRSILKIVMGKLTSNLKQKQVEKYVGNPSWKFHIL